MLSKLVVLQRAGGWTDRETVRRASYDLEVKDCLGLGVEQKGPSQSTLCRHRQAMQQKGLDQEYHLRFIRLLKTLELVGPKEAVLVDSVPVQGAGQVMDSYNLLAAGIRRGLKQLGEYCAQGEQEVGKRLGLLDYLDRGIKGRLGVDWDSEQGPVQLLARLVGDAARVQQEIERVTAARSEGQGPQGSQAEQPADGQCGGPPSPTPADPEEEPSRQGGSGSPSDPQGAQAEARATETQAAEAMPAQDALRQTSAVLAAVIEHDVEFDEHGQVKGLRQQAAGDRLISMTDPDMRHGRKSASTLIAGYKAQVVASVLFGFILLTRVIRANQHDGEILPQLLEGLSRLGVQPSHVIGDHAYGTLKNHAHMAERNAKGLIAPQELVARMARPQNGGRFTKDQFLVDLEQRTVTCPMGQVCTTMRWASREQERGWEFAFAASSCGACPRRAQCINPKSKEPGRTLFIVPDRERLIRAHLQRRQELDFIALLSQRPHIERVIAGLAQCGGKQAHRMGQANVDFDETLSALGYNLRRLGAVLKQRPDLAPRLAAVVLVFLCLMLLCRRLASTPR